MPECCETETVTVAVTYFVEATMANISGPQRFGPVKSCAKAEELLLVLSGRSDVQKAEVIRVTEGA